MFDVINNRDDVFDTTDNDDEDDLADKKSVNNQEDTVNAVEDNGDDSETNKTLPLDGFRSFVGLFNPDLPFFFSIADIFCGVDWLFFVMVSSMNDCLKRGSMMRHTLFYLYQIAVSCANGSVGNKYKFLCLISFTRCYIFPWILGKHKDIFQWIFGRQIFQLICWKQVLIPMSDISEHIKISSNGSLEEHKSSSFG
jgi:hypothetical protein